MTILHATGIYFEGKGLLLRGKSGVGKSDLAIRMMSRGAELVGDDYVELTVNRQGQLIMTAPKNIAGKIELHNVGIIDVPYRASAVVDLVLDLVDGTGLPSLDRLPSRETVQIAGKDIPCLGFYGLEASAPEKISAALKLHCS